MSVDPEAGERGAAAAPAGGGADPAEEVERADQAAEVDQVAEVERAEAAEPDPTVAAPAPTADGAGARRGTVVYLAVLCVALSALLVVLAVLVVQARNDKRRVETANQALARVASTVVSRLTNFDYTNLNGWRGSIVSLATGQFRQEFEADFPGLQATFTTTKARSTGTVTDVFTTSVERTSGRAIVKYSSTVEGAAGRRSVDSYIEVSLVRSGSSWLVDSVNPIEGGAPTPSPPTTGP